MVREGGGEEGGGVVWRGWEGGEGVGVVRGETGGSRSSFMFDIVHKLFSLLRGEAVGCLWDGLACLRLRLDQHF